MPRVNEFLQDLPQIQPKKIQQNLAITIASGPRIFNDIARLSLTFGSDRGLGPKISNDTARFLYGVHGPIVISRDRYSEVLLYNVFECIATINS
jgi:hypothetical protein